LLALPVLAGVRLPAEQIRSLAAKLGSDVPFFLFGGTALGLGRGEELYPLPDRLAEMALLVVPNVHSSTADAYRDVSATLVGNSPTADPLTNIGLQNKLDSFQSAAWADVGDGSGRNKSSLINDFENVVMARHPQLGEIRERLRRAGAIRVAMTGSGSGIFGTFDNPGKLELARLSWEKRAEPGERVFSVSFITRKRYQSAWLRALKQDRKGNDTWPPQSRHAR
jgi:4-diphosphocytidyl-2-C-methyl-D-erythritol kinase